MFCGILWLAGEAQMLRKAQQCYVAVAEKLNTHVPLPCWHAMTTALHVRKKVSKSCHLSHKGLTPQKTFSSHACYFAQMDS